MTSVDDVRLGVICVVSALCLQLPVHSQERTSLRFPGLFGALSREAHRDDRDIGNCPCVGAAPDHRRIFSGSGV